MVSGRILKIKVEKIIKIINFQLCLDRNVHFVKKILVALMSATKGKT